MLSVLLKFASIFSSNFRLSFITEILKLYYILQKEANFCPKNLLISRGIFFPLIVDWIIEYMSFSVRSPLDQLWKAGLKWL